MTVTAPPRVRTKVQPVITVGAGVFWRTVSAGWWASRGWHTARTRVLTAVDDASRR
jgi:hypothetical protein